MEENFKKHYPFDTGNNPIMINFVLWQFLDGVQIWKKSGPNLNAIQCVESSSYVQREIRSCTIRCLGKTDQCCPVGYFLRLPSNNFKRSFNYLSTESKTPLRDTKPYVPEFFGSQPASIPVDDND